ncbi:MAG: hypothetical protein ACLRX1_06885, partial [Ruminococcus sp.]
PKLSVGIFADTAEKLLTHNEFTLKLKQSNYTVMYYNCKILGEREYTKDGFVYRELLITSSERRSFNE